MGSEVLIQTNFPDLKLHSRGKVRDMYDLGEHLLIVTTDRISAFDVVLPQGIPNKGKVLNQISIFWFGQMEDIIPNHLVAVDVDDFPQSCKTYKAQLEGRSMVVRKTRPLPVECIARGYISGSGWKDYQATGKVCGIALPRGLRESDRLEDPIFTPSTKAAEGLHDENISFEQAVELVGKTVANRIRETTIAIYDKARNMAAERGIIIADTKMEYGWMNDELIVIDELLTPDSSRFWPASDYAPGRSQKSYDKQFVRDYLTSINWNKKPPAPDLPPEVIATTGEKYVEALRQLNGLELQMRRN